MVVQFSIPSMVDFPYRMEDFDTQFEFSDVISRWSFYNLLVSLKVETGLQKDLGVARMSRTWDQIGGTSGFCDLCSIAWDYK